MRISVFTSTYNRAYIIERLFISLKSQTYKDFEWIIVNDGSTDNTDALIKRWIQSAPFEIKLINTANGGKHRAINKGIEVAEGDLFYIVDSDDILPIDALETIDKIERTIPNNKRTIFAGICGLKGLISTNLSVGSTFSNQEFLDITMLQRDKNNIVGDKAEVFYTNILKKYRFPEFENENFLTECVVWDKIAHNGFKMRFFNKIIYLCEYLSDGLTANSNELFKNNPKGYGLYIRQSIKYKKIKGYTKWSIISSYVKNNSKNFSRGEISKMLATSRLHIFVDVSLFKVLYFMKKAFKGTKK